MQRAEGGPAFNTRAAKVDAGRPVTPDSEITENSLAIMATDKPLRTQQFSGSQDRVLSLTVPPGITAGATLLVDPHPSLTPRTNLLGSRCIDTCIHNDK